ncbi:MAG: hypothetical protein SFV15_05815 [Polyangiaceae bacterium]|nr:hypothetical protein [Polyangiaceae bacterium]
MRVFLLCLPACLLLQGCSFLFTHGPPPEHEKLDYFDCDASAAGPVADVSWALTDGVMTAALVSANNRTDDTSRPGGTSVGIFTALTAVHTASAIYGAVKINQCSDAREHLRQRISTSTVENQRIINELQRQLDAARGMPNQAPYQAPVQSSSTASQAPLVPPPPPAPTTQPAAPLVPPPVPGIPPAAPPPIPNP